MNLLSAILSRLTTTLLAPFVNMPLVGLVFWSAVAGVVMTFVFGKTSSQCGLKRAVDDTRAQLLAIKLFKDDLSVTFRCQVALMKATGRRLLYSLPPTLVMMVPFVLVLTHLAVHYEHRPLRPGEPALVSVRLSKSAWDRHQDLALHESTSGEVVATEALRDAKDRSLWWKLSAVPARNVTLRWKIGDRMIEKQLAAADDVKRLASISVQRPGSGLIDRLLYPAEPGFDSNSPVKGIEVTHPLRSTELFSLDLPWWVTFLIVSMLTAVLVRRFFGVQF